MQKQNSSAVEYILEEYPGETYSQIQGKMATVQGWPGFRNRIGRLGTDPLDTDFELAHMEGVIVRKLIDRQVFTTNPFYLFFMALWGIILVAPLVVSIIETIQGRPMIIVNILYLPHELIGVGLIINVIKSLSYKYNRDQEDSWSNIVP
jgi:hypothetical protein